MDIQAEKIELAKMLLETQDKSLIQEIRDLFSRREKDFWHTLPQHVKDGIEAGKQQIKDGNYYTYEDIQKELDDL